MRIITRCFFKSFFIPIFCTLIAHTAASVSVPLQPPRPLESISAYFLVGRCELHVFSEFQETVKPVRRLPLATPSFVLTPSCYPYRHLRPGPRPKPPSIPPKTPPSQPSCLLGFHLENSTRRNPLLIFLLHQSLKVSPPSTRTSQRQHLFTSLCRRIVIGCSEFPCKHVCGKDVIASTLGTFSHDIRGCVQFSCAKNLPPYL